jgi:hypothetical protein
MGFLQQALGSDIPAIFLITTSWRMSNPNSKRKEGSGPLSFVSLLTGTAAAQAANARMKINIFMLVRTVVKCVGCSFLAVLVEWNRE